MYGQAGKGTTCSQVVSTTPLHQSQTASNHLINHPRRCEASVSGQLAIQAAFSSFNLGIGGGSPFLSSPVLFLLFDTAAVF